MKLTRITSAVTALLVASILTLSTASLMANEIFTDTGESPYQEEIKAVSGQGIMNGVGKGLFAPDKELTFAEAIQLTVNLLDMNTDNIRFIKEPLATDYFVNANNHSWYNQAMISYSVNGGQMDPNIMPGDLITKELFLNFLVTDVEQYKEMPKVKIEHTEIVDEEEIQVDYQGAIQRALTYGLVTLDASGQFNPKDTILREEVAAILVNLTAYLERQSQVDLEADFESALDYNLVDEGIELVLTVGNLNDQAVTIVYPSSQTFNYIVYDENGDMLYNWAADKSFLMMLTEVTVLANEELVSTVTWDLKDGLGNIQEAGKYRIVMETAFYFNEDMIEISEEVVVELTD